MTSLAVINQMAGCGDDGDTAKVKPLPGNGQPIEGPYVVAPQALCEDTNALKGDEFIFDVQTHMVDPAGAWRSSAGKYWERILANFPQGSCGDEDPVNCFSADKFIKHVFMDSDTELAVLSFVPELPERNPLSLDEANRVLAHAKHDRDVRRCSLRGERSRSAAGGGAALDSGESIGAGETQRNEVAHLIDTIGGSGREGCGDYRGSTVDAEGNGHRQVVAPQDGALLRIGSRRGRSRHAAGIVRIGASRNARAMFRLRTSVHAP